MRVPNGRPSNTRLLLTGPRHDQYATSMRDSGHFTLSDSTPLTQSTGRTGHCHNRHRQHHTRISWLWLMSTVSRSAAVCAVTTCPPDSTCSRRKTSTTPSHSSQDTLTHTQ